MFISNIHRKQLIIQILHIKIMVLKEIIRPTLQTLLLERTDKALSKYYQ